MTPPATARRVLGLLCFALLSHCADSTVHEFESEIRVESDPGQPLAKASVSRAGLPLGRSDANGRIALKLRGAAGDSVALEVTCPDGHRAPGEPLTVLLRDLKEGTGKPEYRVRCAPELRTLVISVRAREGSNVPLKYLGKELARTDAEGAAHAKLKLAPGESVELVLDTSEPEHAALRPQNPELKLVMPERDEVVLFEQTFFREVKREPTKRRVKSVGPQRL